MVQVNHTALYQTGRTRTNGTNNSNDLMSTKPDNGYKLGKRWWDWCFRNTGRFTPTHGILYHWYVEACNRLHWPETFEMAPQYAMAAIGVSRYNTYKDTLADLQQWGFVRVRQKGINQHVPWILALSKFDEALHDADASALSNFDIPLTKIRDKKRVASSKFDKANVDSALSNFDNPRDKAPDKATVKANASDDVSAVSNFDEANASDVSVALSNFDTARNKALDKARNKALDKADRVITINNKQETLNDENVKQNLTDTSDTSDAPSSEKERRNARDRERRALRRTEAKKEKKNKPPVPADPLTDEPTIVTKLRRIVEANVEGYYWKAKDAAAAKSVATQLRHAIRQNKKHNPNEPVTDEQIEKAFLVLIQKSYTLHAQFHFTDMPKLNGKFNQILTQIRNAQQANGNGHSHNGHNGAAKPGSLEQVAQVFSGIDDYVSQKQGK